MQRCTLRTPASAGRNMAHKRFARARLVPLRAVEKSVFSHETKLLLKAVLTRQAVRTTLQYMSETNGELHYYFHNYLADNPLPPLGSKCDVDDWLVDLASSPWTKVQDPRRSSVPSAAAAAAVTKGEREVSPRDIAERVMQVRSVIALEMQETLEGVQADNQAVLRKALERMCVTPSSRG